jgi:hypothetical protein
MPCSIIAILTLLLAAGVVRAQPGTPTSATPAPRQVAVEVVSTDPLAQTLTVRQPGRLNVATTETPEDTSIVTLQVQSGAVSGLRSVRSGQEVQITCVAPAGADTGTTIAALPSPGAAATGTPGASTPGPQAGTTSSAAAENGDFLTAAGRIPGASAASATAATSAGATPTFPAPGTVPGPATGTSTSFVTSVRPLSALEGNCEVAAVRAP